MGKIQYDIDFPDIMQYVIDVYEELLDDHKMERMVQLVQELNNITRMQTHRGIHQMK